MAHAPDQGSRSRARLDRSLPVVGAFFVGAIAYGGLYCFPPISAAFGAQFGVSRSLAVVPWTAFLLVSGLSSPFLGRAYDRFFDRQLLTVGMLLLAAGWVIAASAPGMAVLIVAYGAVMSIGLQLVFVGVSTAVSRRYAGVAGLALGIAYAGPGIGVAVTLPVVTAALASVDWRTVSLAFAVLSLGGVPFVWLMTSGPAVLVPLPRPATPQAPTGTGVAVPAASPPATRQAGLPSVKLAIVDRDAHGALREISAPGSLGAAQEVPAVERPGRGATLHRTLRTRRFWILFAGAVAIGAIDEGVFQVYLPHAIQRGVSSDLAAQALGLQSLSYVGGQILGGGLSDRFGRRFVGLGFALLSALGVTGAFLGSSDLVLLGVVGIVAHGFGIGASIAVRSAAFSDVFGGHDFGAIFGVLAIAYPMGGVIVMQAGAIGFDRLHSYWLVYGMVMVSLAIWATALTVAGPRRHGLRARLARLGGGASA